MHTGITSAFKPAVRNGRKYQNPIETSVGGFGMMLKVLKLYLTNEEERVPAIPLGPFRTDPVIFRTPPASGLRITWFGHSSTLIEIDGVRVLVDPVWDPRASPLSAFGPKRFFEAPLLLDEMPRLDAVLISHDHYDHLGKQTIRNLARLEAVSGAQWVTSSGVGAELRRFGVQGDRISELNWTQSHSIQSRESSSRLSVTSLPARHFSGRKPWNRFETLWSSFVLRGDRHNLYYGADSGMWEGFSAIGQEFGPFHLTMLEVGAYNDLWKSIHLGPDGAAEAFAAIGAEGLLMPIHWGLFDLALHSWRHPIERITNLADQFGFRLWSPEPGIPTEVRIGEEHRSDWWVPITK
jgi:L-ascorbate metabolism protein UlaG (beta-lactamase superfamily)